MPTPATPSNSRPTGDDRNLVTVDATTAVTFEDKLNLFWGKYRGVVIGAIVVVFVAILGKAGWDYLARQREADVGKAYAAATTNDQLKAFAAAHSGHTLANLALLQVADNAYVAGKGADALAGYEKVIGALKDGPLVARAQLG
ncbi:MAG TPA: tetratricopeptide repeat protein, partial [Opitutaceae bacterium]|nr:tetratricopeptide repeat protein [Opitutaceae bacterium]